MKTKRPDPAIGLLIGIAIATMYAVVGVGVGVASRIFK